MLVEQSILDHSHSFLNFTVTHSIIIVNLANLLGNFRCCKSFLHSGIELKECQGLPIAKLIAIGLYLTVGWRHYKLLQLFTHNDDKAANGV
ncbi:hypothetical protein CEXT_338921 [Caerostris extrusa]|uniref:Uncharacterized protein n=1 Tax=Caerostris extrusa TaxID=172846 RepID=A0AAV4XLT2_CAEEX|nr:hypothetical protein CEXT_338921 [Caerostris extrusa]